MGKRPCHAQKKEAHLWGLEYHRMMHDRMANVNAMMVRAACAFNSPSVLDPTISACIKTCYHAALAT